MGLTKKELETRVESLEAAVGHLREVLKAIVNAAEQPYGVLIWDAEHALSATAIKGIK